MKVGRLKDGRILGLYDRQIRGCMSEQDARFLLDYLKVLHQVNEMVDVRTQITKVIGVLDNVISPSDTTE